LILSFFILSALKNSYNIRYVEIKIKGVKGMTNLLSLIATILLAGLAIGLFRYRKKKGYRIGLLVLLMTFLAIGMTGCSDSDTTSSTDKSDSVKVEKKTTYVGKDEYNIAKKENVALVAKEKKLLEQEASLTDQQDKIESDEAAAKKQAQAQQAAAQKQQEQQAKEAQKQQNQAQQASNQQSQSSSQSRGDMNTGNAGTIVGNSNSHIYHMPGQRGYNMNSSNAVYFNTEQEAINAGYRKAKV